MRYRSRTKPRRHQAIEYNKHRRKNKRGLFWSMRSGKTKAVIDLLEYRFRVPGDRITGVLVLAPNGVHDNWVRKEFPIHCSTPYVGAAYRAKSRTTKWHEQMMDRLLKCPKDKLAVLAINSETMWREHSKAYMGKFLARHKGRLALIVDESHDYRTPSSKRFRVARAYAKHCKLVRILTGTPDSNTPLAHWAQFELLGKGILGFDRYTDFKYHHAVVVTRETKSGQKFEAIDRYRNLDELRSKIAKHVSVVTKEDAGLEPVIDCPIPFFMSDAQKMIYEKVQKELMLDDMVLDGGAMLAKLQQISRGWYYQEDGSVKHIMKLDDNPAMTKFLSLAGSSKKTIVWARHRQEAIDLAQFCKKHGLLHVTYRGGMSSDAKAVARAKFQDNPAIRVFIGQPKAGGTGIDLSNADQIIWYSHVFDRIDYEQASERASAVWKEKGVDVFHLIAHNTVDDYILKAHKRKADISNELSGSGLKELLESLDI